MKFLNILNLRFMTSLVIIPSHDRKESLTNYIFGILGYSNFTWSFDIQKHLKGKQRIRKEAILKNAI